MVPPITFYAPVHSHKLDAQPRLLFLWSDVDTRRCTSFLRRCEPEGEKSWSAAGRWRQAIDRLHFRSLYFTLFSQYPASSE